MTTGRTRAGAGPAGSRGRTIYFTAEEWRDVLRFSHLETRSASSFVREASKARCRQIAMSHLVEGLRGR